MTFDRRKPAVVHLVVRGAILCGVRLTAAQAVQRTTIEPQRATCARCKAKAVQP